MRACFHARLHAHSINFTIPKTRLVAILTKLLKPDILYVFGLRKNMIRGRSHNDINKITKVSEDFR